MEAVASLSASTGSRTMADLAHLAAEKHAEKPALIYKSGDEWLEVSYEKVGQVVSEVARGLIAIGLGHGDKVSILSHTRPEWTYANLAILSAGTVSVSIYQTNSAEESHYVLEHSESKAVFVEDAEQLAKVRAVEGDLPVLEHIVIFDPPAGSGDLGNAITLAQLREMAPPGPRTSSQRAATPSRRTTSASRSTRPAPPVLRRAA